MISFDLLVLRCADIDQTRSFYELVGIPFVREQHGAGAAYFATELDGITVELYPASSTRPPEAGLRIGLKVDHVDAVANALVAAGHEERGGEAAPYLDPDGRIVVFSNDSDEDG